MKIYLIRLPGSGKSTLGKQLADKLHYDFLDLDNLIVLKEQKTISELFSLFGEPFFRELEKDILHSTKNFQHTIIACGGGTPCFFDNMEWINQNGVSVFLNSPVNTIIPRLINDTTRPLLMQNKEDTLNKLLKERIKFYQKAQLEIKNSSAEELVSLFHKNKIL